VYWISIENGDKSADEMAKAVECPVPYNRAEGKYGIASSYHRKDFQK
jgi:hypothetical protein